ncbi:tripartite tricarboxylate transporter substrate binding protein [Belnapia sp. T6]|uniref:Tripartite tricarboxylate transporter substrate binding protein n=1 Tax=Belnapia mucosa TaxID=2804532 RepID=A0ABS1V175_9PROT|nr:tripartite tricarboxylate transporter substrate binding protein [Belnapia mucosa]MBL6455002.1 tripartite tricarboxylate transporter substrate binding protein [Belnapia mucosa]
MHRRHVIGAAALLLAGRHARAEEEWPARNVTILIPFAPGSSSDIIGRAMAQGMQQALGKPVVAENRPGATGEVGARAVIRSAPDGYTLMHAPISTWAINVALRPNLAYDPVTQLTRITQTVRTPNVLVVHPGQVPAKTLPELLDWLRAQRGRASYSTSGIGSSDHLTMEMFKQATGTDAAHVPYAGGGPATTDLIAGTVQLSFQNLGSIAPQIRDGRVRPILITSEARSPLLPEVPTATESGLRDFVVYSWQGFGGPAGMPAPLVARIHGAAVAALRQPQTEARLSDLGFEVVGNSPEEFANFQQAEIARWKRVVTAGGITAD